MSEAVENAAEIVQYDETPQVSPVANMLQAIERAAINPEVDVEKMERLMAMAERMQDRSAEQEFNAAMVEVQRSLEPVRKRMQNKQTQSNYADLADVAQEVNDKFTVFGFSLSFYEGECPKEDYVRVMCDVMHSAGHTKTRHVDMPIVTAGTGGKVMMTLTHATGSAFSYGRRYLSVLIANLPTPDNDGNGAAKEYKRITEDQSFAIDAFIQEHDLDMAVFMDWLKRVLKVTSIAEIPDSAHDNVWRALKKKAA